MPQQLIYRALAVASGALLLAACSPTDSTSARMQPKAAMSITASAISSVYLPTPAGVSLYVAHLSAGGYIIGYSQGQVPYVWTAPYTSAPTAFSEARGIAGGASANDLGDFRASGQGYYQHNGADWQFTSVSTGPYTSINVTEINNSRNVVAWGSLNGSVRGLWWADAGSQPVELPAPVRTGTVTSVWARSLNNVGDIVGYIYEDVVSGRKKVTYNHAVLWRADDAGVWHATVLKGAGTNTFASQINDAGQILGTAAGSVIMWTPTNGAYGDPVVIGTTTSGTARIDQCGRVVSSTNSNTPSKRRAWVWENGVTTQLPIPSGAVAIEAKWIKTELATGQGIIVGGAMPSGAQNANTSFVPVRWTIPGCPLSQ